MGHLVEPGTLVGSMLAKQENSVVTERSAVLIYLCAASDDLCHSPSRLQYVDLLGKKLVAQAMGPDASLARVLWALIIDFENFGLECPERTWLLSRMLYVATKLSADLRRKLDNQLLRFLVSDDRDDLVLSPADFEAKVWRDIALVNVNEEKARTKGLGLSSLTVALPYLFGIAVQSSGYILLAVQQAMSDFFANTEIECRLVPPLDA